MFKCVQMNMLTDRRSFGGRFWSFTSLISAAVLRASGYSESLCATNPTPHFIRVMRSKCITTAFDFLRGFQALKSCHQTCAERAFYVH